MINGLCFRMSGPHPLTVESSMPILRVASCNCDKREPCVRRHSNIVTHLVCSLRLREVWLRHRNFSAIFRAIFPQISPQFLALGFDAPSTQFPPPPDKQRVYVLLTSVFVACSSLILRPHERPMHGRSHRSATDPPLRGLNSVISDSLFPLFKPFLASATPCPDQGRGLPTARCRMCLNPRRP
jgi:hypothetical protein